MSSTHRVRPLAPAWSIIGLTSSVPIAFAITVIGLANISPFAANIIGLTYTLAVSLACAFVILAAHYPPRPNANPRFSNFLLRSARWLDVIDSNSGTRIGINQMSDQTRERLRIAAGGVVRAPPSVRSTITLPPYTPHGHPHTHIQRPERALDQPFPPMDNMDFLDPRSRMSVADHDEIRPVDEILEAVIERSDDFEAQRAVVEAERGSEH